MVGSFDARIEQSEVPNFQGNLKQKRHVVKHGVESGVNFGVILLYELNFQV